MRFTESSRRANNIMPVAIISVIVITAILYCFSDGISGNDFWWHIKVGEYISENGAVPTTDIFSWFGVENGISWTAHEWLADLVFFIIHDLFGSIGIYILSIGMAILMTFLLLWQCKAHFNRNLLICGLFFALFAVLTSLFFYGRPHIFSYFLLFFELKILYEFYENSKTRKIYFLPLIAVLWSNLHGGSANLCYILPIAFLIAGLFNFTYGRIESYRYDKRSFMKLLIITLLSVVGILINPVGIKVLLYPYESFGDTLMMSVISEWQSPDAKIIGDLILFFFPIVLMSIGIISYERKIRIIDLIVMALFLLLFFRSSRFIILWYIAAAFYAFRYIPECRIKDITKNTRIVVIVALLLIFLIPTGISVKNTITLIKNDKLISKVISEEAVEAVKDDSPQRIFNDYNIGETLIYNDIPVFFDARADLYAQNHILEDGVSLMYLEQANSDSDTIYVDVDELIGKYKFDAILILKNRPLYSYLISHPEKYVCEYEDEKVGYFKTVIK